MDNDEDEQRTEDASFTSASRKYNKRKTGESNLLVASKSDDVDEDFLTSTNIMTKSTDNNAFDSGNHETNADIQIMRSYEQDKEASRIRAKNYRMRHKKAFQELMEENASLKIQNQILTELVNLQQIEISTLEGVKQRLFFRAPASLSKLLGQAPPLEVGGSGGGATGATGARPLQSNLFSTSISLGGRIQQLLMLEEDLHQHHQHHQHHQYLI